MSTLVMKFGGASLGTATAFSQVLNIVMSESPNWDHILLVVSALEGVTDVLLEAANLARIDNQRGYRRIAANLRSRHLALVQQLPLDRPEYNTLQADIDQLLSSLLDNCVMIANNLEGEPSPAQIDKVVAVGERLSARIIAALLRQYDMRGIAVDGADLLVTDDVFGNANPDLELTARQVNELLKPMLQRNMIPVITGYIGATSEGEITTLGRGGTDYTASVISALLEAEELWIWTDIAGMMSADPGDVPQAHVIPQLDYNEAAELAYFGARILHARMIAPVANRGMPMQIKNIFEPEKSGTLVCGDSREVRAIIKAVTSIQGLSLRRPSSGSLAGATRLIGGTLLKTLGMRTEVMIASQSSNSSFLCFVIPTSIGIDGVDRLQQALAAKMAEYPEKMPWTIETVSLVTAIGSNLHRSPKLLAEVLAKLADIEVYGLALGASNCSITVAIPLQDTQAALLRIHELISGSDAKSGSDIA